jgi:hypothetical protein
LRIVECGLERPAKSTFHNSQSPETFASVLDYPGL